jgi:nitrite reductase/ring-hydroxylating ferredoxin subunit
VYYEKDQNRLECPCHQGFFSIADGSVVQGPPQRALPRVALETIKCRLLRANPVNNATSLRPANRRGSIQVAIRVRDQRVAERAGAIRARKAMQHRFLAG